MNFPARPFSVLRGEEFIKDVAAEAARARRLIWAQSMDYEPGDITDRFTKIFSNAAGRGLDAKLNIDYYALYNTDGEFNYFSIINRKKFYDRKRRLIARLQALHNLRHANVDVQLHNKPGIIERIIPSIGRNHMKLVIVDDTAAWLGGINFTDINFLLFDFMVKITDPHFIYFLKQLYLHMHDGERIFDLTTNFEGTGRLFVDGGTRGKSIIFDEAVHLLNYAHKSIDFTSPFFPDSEVLIALHDAHLRGVKVRVICPALSHLDGLGKLSNAITDAITKIENRKIPMLLKPVGMHSKLIIVDGNAAIFGSHNFTNKGVTLGTAEIALLSQNTELLHHLNSYFHTLLNA